MDREIAASRLRPNLLFRGGFPGETIGPYISQFLIQDTSMGALPIIQKYTTAKENVDFMKDPTTFLQVQNGISTGLQLQPDTPLFLHNGRGLAAYTHVDVLYQAYFTAYLVLNTINGGTAAPLNPGNPYIGSKTQNGFGTMGQPDIAATLDRCGQRGAQGGVVPKVVCASSPSSGIGRRDRVFDQNRQGQHDPGPG